MKQIKLTQGKYALVDDEDFEFLNQFNWCYRKNRNKIGYAVKGSPNIFLHRLLTQAPNNLQVDHLNGNSLDNRKVNLRLCTIAQNRQNSPAPSTNTSGYKGVCRDRNLWLARIYIKNKEINLGRYKTPQEAAKKYNEAAQKYHKEFARLNCI